jgi:hypothetical protein
MSADASKGDGMELALSPEERPAAPPGKPAQRLRRSWSRMRFRVGGSFGAATSASAVQAGTVEGTEAQPARPQRHKKGWREQRWERRRRRRLFEEVLGWILVPIILIAIYWGLRAGLNALGTTPTALIQGIRTAIRGGGGL